MFHRGEPWDETAGDQIVRYRHLEDTWDGSPSRVLGIA
jgi:hypothetical protein